ncbi:MAG: HAD hydrolase-like protein, partial [Chloroflexi bacterium]|nr:HAD hydrolase-like protein [Chloroflexota bacterium]
MGDYKAIIFDMDGVLVDSEPLFLKAINSLVIQENAEPISEDENRDHLIGTTIEETWRRLKQLRGLPLSIPEYIQRYEVVVEQVLKQELAAQPGVVALIE